ncbi:tripartite tricarboxylate transporter TctB family protein [Pelagibacterium mangrovi]|uniref:tripartite tricarboxylate transporter TctB family protein n=1 Tax=Pelagibacterium mangrovi TaxID=3119828 RepID=UPI002FC635BD
MNITANSPDRARIIVAAGLLIFAAFYLYSAFGLSFGAWNNPRAGFLPRIAGVAGVVLAAANLLMVILKERTRSEFGATPLRAVFFVLGLITYVPALQWLGFIPATAMLMLYLVKIYEGKGWIVPVVVSAATTGLVYVLFRYLLQLPLP